MSEPRPWRCKECGTTLGWEDENGLNVDLETIERYTVPSLTEEIWVTCGICGAVQIWRARAELGPAPDGGWHSREEPEPKQLK
jgi:hypothetical protein